MSRTIFLYLRVALLVSNFKDSIACGPIFRARNVGNNAFEQVFQKFHVPQFCINMILTAKQIFILEEWFRKNCQHISRMCRERQSRSRGKCHNDMIKIFILSGTKLLYKTLYFVSLMVAQKQDGHSGIASRVRMNVYLSATHYRI